MSSRTRLLVFLVSTPLVVLVAVGGIMGSAPVVAQRAAYPPLRVFQEVIQYVLGAYVEDVDADRIMDGAMRGLADGLDASSAYLTPAEVKEFDAKTPPAPGDVGLVLTRQFYLRVVGVRDGSPAARAGLQSGDFIRAINDAPTRNVSAPAGMHLLRGPVGSKVSLLVIRGNAADPHVVNLVREARGTALVSSKKLPGGEAYVRITSFAPGTADAVRAAITGLGASATPGVIVDVRDIADGTPEDGVAAARLFVKEGVLATRAGRAPTDRQVVSAAAGDGALTMPVVLLVSNGTANAAEVFAAALSGTKRATLVGEPTAGIAAVQRLVRLPDGHGLLMTVSRYLQADGKSIHEEGVRPEVIEQAPTVGFDEQPPPTDAILTRALPLIKK